MADAPDFTVSSNTTFDNAISEDTTLVPAYTVTYTAAEVSVAVGNESVDPGDYVATGRNLTVTYKADGVYSITVGDETTLVPDAKEDATESVSVDADVTIAAIPQEEYEASLVKEMIENTHYQLYYTLGREGDPETGDLVTTFYLNEDLSGESWASKDGGAFVNALSAAIQADAKSKLGLTLNSTTGEAAVKVSATFFANDQRTEISVPGDYETCNRTLNICARDDSDTVATATVRWTMTYVAPKAP